MYWRFFNSLRPAYGIVLSLCSNFVEVIQHFAACAQHNNTQRDNQKGGHFLSSSWAAASKLRGSFSVDEFSVEVTDAVVPNASVIGHGRVQR